MAGRTYQLKNWKYEKLCKYTYDSFGKISVKDVWRLCGDRNDEKVYISCPKVFDEEKMIVTTKSGNYYELLNCEGVLAEESNRIREDIKRGCYQVE